jgi:hypothetical protein
MPNSILLRADQVIEEACLLQRMSLFLRKADWRRNGWRPREVIRLLANIAAVSAAVPRVTAVAVENLIGPAPKSI